MFKKKKKLKYEEPEEEEFEEEDDDDEEDHRMRNPIKEPQQKNQISKEEIYLLAKGTYEKIHRYSLRYLELMEIYYDMP